MNYKEELEKIYSTKEPPFESDFLNKDIILYGAGSLGKMACDLLKKQGIKPKYIVDKKTKGELSGLKIISTDKIPLEDKKSALFIICISTLPYNDIEAFLKDLGIENTIQFYTYAYLKFPKLHSNGWTCYSPTDEDKKNIEKVCELLSHDNLSICHYLQFLWWKIRGIEKIYLNFPVLSGKKFFKSPAMPKLNDKEILLDIGAHFGQTIESFKNAVDDHFEKIYALEPDGKNLSECKKKYYENRIEYIQKAVSNFNGKFQFQSGLGYASKLDEEGDTTCDVITIDSLNIAPTVIKLHIEGEELKALEGAVKTMNTSKPTLMILADHNIDGLYKIPLFMYNQGYKLYFNLHDYCGNSAVFYGVRDDRTF